MSCPICKKEFDNTDSLIFKKDEFMNTIQVDNENFYSDHFLYIFTSMLLQKIENERSHASALQDTVGGVEVETSEFEPETIFFRPGT